MREREAAHKAEKRLERQLSRQSTTATSSARPEGGGLGSRGVELSGGLGWKGDVSRSQDSMGSQHRDKGSDKGFDKEKGMDKSSNKGWNKGYDNDITSSSSSSSQGIGFRRSYDNASPSSPSTASCSHAYSSHPLNSTMATATATMSMRSSALQQHSLVPTDPPTSPTQSVLKTSTIHIPIPDLHKLLRIIYIYIYITYIIYTPTQAALTGIYRPLLPANIPTRIKASTID